MVVPAPSARALQALGVRLRPDLRRAWDHMPLYGHKGGGAKAALDKWSRLGLKRCQPLDRAPRADHFSLSACQQGDMLAWAALASAAHSLQREVATGVAGLRHL